MSLDDPKYPTPEGAENADEGAEENKGNSFDPDAFKQEILSELNNTITGAVGRIKRDTQKDMTSMQENMTNSITEALSKVLQPQQQPSQPESEGNEPPKKPPGEDSNPFEEQFRQFQKQQQILQKQLEEERQNRIKAERAQIRANAENGFINAIRDRAHNPRHFLNALESDGVVEFGEDGQFYVREKDQFGDEVKIPVNQKLDDLYKLPDYSFYLKPRPGNGAGGSSATPTKKPKGASIYNQEVSDADRFDSIRGGSLEDLLKQVENAAGE